MPTKFLWLFQYFGGLLRLKEISSFIEMTASKGKPINILDVGGCELFWEKMGLAGNENYQITILNLLKFKIFGKPVFP